MKTLRQSEQFNSSLLKNSPNAIIVINLDTSIAYVNPALEKLTGFSSSQIVGREAPYPWWVVKDSSGLLKYFRQSLNRPRVKQEHYFRKKNGDYFWVEVNTTLIKNEGTPEYYFQTWVDITESKRWRENLEFFLIQITRAQEEERKRIARDLHEETVQSLAALSMTTESILQSEKQSPEEYPAFSSPTPGSD